MSAGRPLVFAAVIGLAAWPAIAEERPARHVLANGVRVLVRENPTAGVVAVSLQVRAGTRLETSDTAGITTFVQRAMLRGTARRTGIALAEAAERIGGRLETAAEVDHAEVRGRALARHWEGLLELVAEVALSPTFPEDEVEKERRLVLSDIRSRAETPFTLAIDTLLAALLGDHPDGRSRLGRAESVGRLARADLTRYHRAIYQPDRLVVGVSGRVEAERVVRVATRLFGRLEAGAQAQPLPLAPPAPMDRRRVVQAPTQQAQVLAGVLIPGLEHPRHAAARVLGALLGAGMAGRLFVELRENLGLAYSVGVLSPLRASPAFLVAHLGTAPDNVLVAEQELRRQLARAAAEPPTAAEVDRAKAYLLGALALDRRTNARHAWYLAFSELVAGGWDFPARYAQAIEAVTPADVADAARRHLAEPTVVVLSPPR